MSILDELDFSKLEQRIIAGMDIGMLGGDRSVMVCVGVDSGIKGLKAEVMYLDDIYIEPDTRSSLEAEVDAYLTKAWAPQKKQRKQLPYYHHRRRF